MCQRLSTPVLRLMRKGTTVLEGDQYLSLAIDLTLDPRARRAATLAALAALS